MNWSLLRKEVRSRICLELRDRVDFHKAVYRNSFEAVYDRAWITLDGREIFSLSHGEWTLAWREAKQSIEAEGADEDFKTRTERTAAVLKEAGFEPTAFLSQSLRHYLNLPIAEALASPNPIVRAFAIVDQRTGKRTLARMTMGPEDHPLTREFYELRVKENSSSTKPDR